MADTVESTEQNVSGSQTFNSPQSGDSKNALPTLRLGDPTNLATVDKGAVSRHSRLQKLVADLNEGDDSEENERRKAQFSKEVAEKIEPEKDDAEPVREQAGAGSPVKPKAATKSDLEVEEERREARRKAGQEAEAGDEPKAEAKTEGTAEAQQAATESTEKAAPKDDKSEADRRAKFEQVLKMEAKAQKDREKLRAREELLIKERADLDSFRKNLQADYDRKIQEHERNVATASQILKLARENPLELLERSGVTPEDVAKWVTNAADPTTQLKKEYDRKFAELERRDADQRRQQEESARRAEIDRQRQAIETEYLGHFEEKDGEEYVLEPARLIYSRKEAIELGNQIANEASRLGHAFTSRDIAEAVNELAKDDERYKTIMRRLSTANKTQETVTGTKSVTTQAPVATKPALSTDTPKQTTTTSTVLNNRTAADAAPPASKGQAPQNWKREREARLRRIQSGLE